MGFDNECILNIQSLAGEYFCPVCRLLVYPNEALQSQCTHLYCKPCLTYVVSTTRACPYDGYLVTEADSKPLTESNKVLAETIGKIAVHCLYHRSGCTWEGPLSDCTSHCSGCSFGNSPVVCNRCGVQIVHRQVQEHAQNCPGVQPQVPQADVVQDSAATGTPTVDQNQVATQAGTTSQAQTSQISAAITPGQDPNLQISSIPQGQAVAQAAVPTPEQWYQQQQQYQQYYQQYPGYDPYQQQYQQYYPYQQAVQQYQQQPVQAHPSNVPGQPQPQAYIQPQPQHQPQPQPQPQVQPQPQPQQPQSHTQPQMHQASVVAQHLNQPQANPQPQVHSAVQPLSQTQMLPHAPPHGHPPPQPQPQPQPYPQPHSMQPYPQPHPQVPQYQQPHPQIQHPLPQPHMQHHPLPQSQPHSQVQPQPHHPQLQPQLHSSQPNQPPNLNVQPQAQAPPPPVHAVTGHHSYPHPQPHQQLSLGAPQHPMHTHLQNVPHQQPQHSAQMQNHFSQPVQMHPPQSHAPIASQHQSTLPSPGQVPTIPLQQIPPHPNAQQPGHLVNQRPVMQPNQQPMPQQYVQQQQQLPFPGQPSGSVPNQLHQQGPYSQPQQLHMHSHLRPQGPTPPLQQHAQAYPQPLQNVALSQSQNHFGRSMIPGAQSQPLPQSASGPTGAGQVKTSMHGANQHQLSTNQNYPHRTNNQGQPVFEQQPGYMQQSVQQSGPTIKSTMSESQGDQLSEKNVSLREESSSQRTAKSDPNNPVITSGLRADSVEDKNLESEVDTKSIDDERKRIGEDEDNTKVSDSLRTLATDPNSHSMENGEPVIKQIVEEEVVDSISEPSSGGKFVENKDQKDVPHNDLKQVENSSLERKEIQGQVEIIGEQGGKLKKDAVNAEGVVLPANGSDRGFLSVPPSSAPVPEHRGHPPPGQLHGRGFVKPSHPVTLHQRPPAPPSGLPPQHGQASGLPLTQLQPQGPGHFPQSGQPLNPPDHFQPPGGILGPGSTSFGRGPSHFGPPQRNFESQSAGPLGHYYQGHVPPSHIAPPRSQGEPVGGPFDAHGGLMTRAPPHGPEVQMGHQRFNPMEAEIFPNPRPSFLDGRQPDLHLQATRMNGPPGLDSSLGLGLRDERFKPPFDERPHSFPVESGRRRGEFEEDLKQFPRPSHLDPEAAPKFGSYFSSSRPIERGPHGFGMDAAPGALDKAPHGFNYDAGLKFDPSASSAPSRFLPPYHPGGTPTLNEAGERARPVRLNEDNVSRPDSTRKHPDFNGPVPGYGRHRMDGSTPRSPVREFPGMTSRGFGSGGPGSQLGPDDIEGRESRRFGEGSKPFNLPSDQIGNSFQENRFPILPSHLRRGEPERNVNMPMGEHISPGPPHHFRTGDLIGQDILPSHLRRGENLGPRNLPGHLRFGEPAGFGAFPSHARIGELAGPGNFPQHLSTGEPFAVGNKPSHPRFGEPGFRSSYSLQGYPNDGGFHLGDMESIDNPRKRKSASMGWCRICKVDCETVEGLDLHSQTREHQKMAMDMVLSIKQQNGKKQKLTSNDHSSVEDASKSRNAIAIFEGRRNKP